MADARSCPVILVVDDEEPIRRAVRRILESDGYTVLDADDGTTGLALLERGDAIDLLVADLEMPELRGDEMARRLRAQRPDLKVLYVSGCIDRLMNERPTLWDGEAFLEKPFTIEGLKEAVALLLYDTVRRPV
jgi:two-component system, cell cycle sensor histidine kinase and response regulator CckA